MSKIGNSVNETTENFWAAWALPQDPPRPAFYRLYHDSNGKFLFYSMEDVPGNYIEIDHETFAAGSPRVQVINGCLHHLKSVSVQKLVPGDQGHACDPNDVAVISNTTHKQYWKLKATDETH